MWITINWKILKETGIPDHLICFLRNLCAGQGATIITLYGTTDWLKIGNRVQQGCILSPCLFNLLRSSVQSQSCATLCWPHEPQHARLPCLSPTPRVHPNPRPLSRWCHPTISSSVVLFSSCPQSFPASGSFPLTQLFTTGGQSIGVSASTSVLQMKTQDWSPLGWTGWISWQFKGLSRVFSNATVQKHQHVKCQAGWITR